MAKLCFIVAGLVAVRLLLNGVFALFGSKPMFKAGTNPTLAAIGLLALALGVAFALLT